MTGGREEAVTAGYLYADGKKALQEAGIGDAALDAGLLLEFVCRISRSRLLACPEERVFPEAAARYRALIGKRSAHIPLAYLTGTQGFMGLEFLVNENVLIPRQDTETLVEEAMKQLHDGFRILDIGTGTGCILLSLLHYSNGCTGVGTDVSGAALEVARANAARLGETSAEFVQGDLFGPVTGKFEMIVSNPPYIRTGVIGTLMEEVRCHEPLSALDGHEDGLFFYRRIIGEGKAHLCGGGMLFLEIGYDQRESVVRLMEEAGYRDVTAVRDLAGLDRVVYGCYYG